MKIKGLDHMGIVSADLEKTRRFYTEFLGLEEVPRPENFKFGGLWLRIEGSGGIHVVLADDTTSDAGIPDPGEGKVGGLVTHFAFVVDELAPYMERAEEMNIAIVGGPYERGLGAKQAYLQDDDGYIVELFERSTVTGKGEERLPIKAAG
ncbi:MAG: VOC family protein [Chloroflexota bacterium]